MRVAPAHRRRYRVVLADAPHLYDNFGLAKHGAARSAYKLQPEEWLARLPVGELAMADSCCLFWCTGPKAAEGYHHSLLEAWGFRCATRLLAWVKVEWACQVCGHEWPRHRPRARGRVRGACREAGCGCQRFVVEGRVNPGFYSLGDVEDLWLGVRGGGMARRRLHQDVRGQLFAPQPRVEGTARPRHSAKPPEVYAMVEALWPGPYLELFAREKRPGWTAWGDQAPGGVQLFQGR